jgi:hypothetical protein
MPIYPNARYRPLDRTQKQAPMASHDLVILHTMVGNLTGTNAYFMANGWTGTESHFGVGGPWGDNRDGEIIQWQDTRYRADAQLEGNHRAISIETGDNAPASAADVKPWTPAQLAALVDIITWCCKTYDIPPVLVPDSKPGRRGIAYHRQGCEHSRGVGAVAGFLVPGGERWSNAVGKECPGPQRIAQIPGIVARVKARLGAELPAKQEADKMSFKDTHKLTAADVRAFGRTDLKVGQEKSFGELMRFPPATERLRRELSAQVGALSGMVTAVLKSVEEGGGLTAEQAAEAAREGARAALAELGDLLDGDDDE